jgi:hypothetical protein
MWGSRSCNGDREGNLAESATSEWGQVVNRPPDAIQSDS